MAINELQGGTIIPSAILGGGTIYPGGGGGENMQIKSVSYTPSETAITENVRPDLGYAGLAVVRVSVGAIDSNYVGSSVPRKSSSDLTASGATVTAPSGYYASNATKAISNASTPYGGISSIDSLGNVTIDFEIDYGGYIGDGTYTVMDTIPVQGAQTITPGTTDQTIASDKYLTGAQTILGDADLVASNIKKGITIFGITGTYEGGAWVEETITTSGAVTKALDPYVLYHFTGALTSLTITLNAPATGQIAHYHFDFLSGSTAPTLTMPNSVTMPDSFAVEASKRYEVDVLNNFGTVVEWAN